MPLWGVIALIAGAVLLLGALGVMAFLGWRALERRYLLRDEEGKIIETPSQLFRRVAHAISSVETKFDNNADVAGIEESFYSMMRNLEFLPNTPTLMNAGTPLGQLSACFVLPVEDSIISIFDTLKDMAIIGKAWLLGSPNPNDPASYANPASLPWLQ